MRKLSIDDIVKDNENCYSFVIAVAKRARQISEAAERTGTLLDEKPVQMAIGDFLEGKFRIVTPPWRGDGEESPDADSGHVS